MKGQTLNAGFNRAVDAYIARAQPFARPILGHLRELVHAACPPVEEAIKWSRPFFEYKGVILCNMSAFKAHCSFGFWGREMAPLLREADVLKHEGMGSLGKIVGVDDLPSDKQMLAWIQRAAASIDAGNHISPMSARHGVVKAERKPLLVPEELTYALRRNKKAEAAFAELSASCRREYVEWIAGAKRAETREKRIATALEWIAEGKPRHSKYQQA
jgi:hypothetical protein